MDLLETSNREPLLNPKGTAGSTQTLSSIKRGGWLTLAGSMCIHLVIGNIYLWGNTGLYIISYFHYLGEQQATSR